MLWGVFKQTFISLRMMYFVHVLLDCNLFEINISYSFRNIKAINLLCKQPLAQLIVILITSLSQENTIAPISADMPDVEKTSEHDNTQLV